jgi:predicted nucleotide-binding protein (sugar kinase/HSP70/actin superfamily)
MQRGVEIAPPILTDFFIQFFVNRKTNKKSMVEKGRFPNWLLNRLYALFQKYVRMFNEACSCFRFYEPFNDIFMEAQNAAEVISLSTQFGEGWLLPGEVVTYYRRGIKNVISMQPFGCIANHIVVRGVEKRIKRKFPDINLLAIDFDGGVSEVNIINRALLFLDNLK